MKKSSLKDILNKVENSRKYIVLLSAIQIATALLGVSTAYVLRALIDAASSGNREGLISSAGTFAGVIAAQILLSYFNRYLSEYTRSSIENGLKGRLFAGLMEKDYASVMSRHSGDWMNLLTSDTVVVADGITSIIPGLCARIARLVGAIVLMGIIAPSFLYLLIPCGIVLFICSYGFRKKLKELHVKIQEADGNFRVAVSDYLTSLLVARAYELEDTAIEETDALMLEHQKARLKRNRFANLSSTGFALAMRGCYLLAAIYCAVRLYGGTMTYGSFAAVLQLVNQIQNPFANISGFIPKYYAMCSSYDRLTEIESFDDEFCGEKADERKINSFRAVGFDNVSFTYMPRSDEDRGVPSVSNLSFEVKRGQCLPLTGPSGSGKSTIIKLLMCMYRCDSGERYVITDNGKEELTSAWRSLFAYVPQGNMLMSGTVRSAVCPHGDVDGERFEKALKIAEVWPFAKGDEHLSEKGGGFSEGQIQRIAIARAIYSDRPILLLDEATSALDFETEKKIIKNIASLTDKTLIIATHRKIEFDGMLDPLNLE